jgi:signal peptidase I
MRKQYILLCFLLLLGSVVCGQNDCLGEDYIRITSFTEGKAGDIIVIRKNASPGISKNKKELEEAVKNNYKMQSDTVPINECTSLVAKYSSNDLLNISVLNNSINWKKHKGQRDSVIIKDGKKNYITDGVLKKVLKDLNKEMLQNLYEETNEGSKLFFITATVYNGTGGKIIRQNTDSVYIGLKVSATHNKDTLFIANPNYKNIDTIIDIILSNPNIPAAYRLYPINKKDLGMADYKALIPFGVKQFCDHRAGMGVLFAVSELGFAAFGTGFMINANKKYDKYKTTEYAPYYNDYKKQRNIAVGCFIGAGLMYLWNVADGFDYFKNVTVAPQAVIDTEGNPQPALAMSIHF